MPLPSPWVPQSARGDRTPTSSTQPLSARGVAGETSKKYGCNVPNYNIYGHQHHRLPFKDKGDFSMTRQRPEWIKEPRHKTKSDLDAARHADKRPHISYDIDGDGVVGQRDYFVGKHFDIEGDQHLTPEELKGARQAIKDGWLDKFSFGHDQAGSKRAYPVHVQRGKIISVNNYADLADTFADNPISKHTPRFWTNTDMANARKEEKKNVHNCMKDDWDMQNPFLVPEPPFKQEFMVAQPPIQHIKQREDANHQTARGKELTGLDRKETVVNPVREHKEVGLEYVAEPVYSTGSALKEARRMEMRRELREQRAEHELTNIPSAAQISYRESLAHKFRQPSGDPMTLSKLELSRKQQFIEHNLENFPYPVKEFTRYSDQDEPWWTMHPGYNSDARECLLHQIREPKCPAVPVTGKVTEWSYPVYVNADGPQQLSPPEVAYDQVPMIHDELGSKTIHRWSEEFEQRGKSQQVPRLFDGIRQAQTYSSDTAPIEQFSSFVNVRDNCLKKTREQRRRHAEEDLARARNWKLHGHLIMDGAAADEDQLPLQTSVQSMGSSRASSRVQNVVKSSATRASFVPMEPVGEDPSMVERLDRTRLPRQRHGDDKPSTPRTPQHGDRGSKANMRSIQGGVSASSTTAPRPSLTGASRPPPVSGSEVGVCGRSTEPVSPKIAVRTSGFQWVNRQTQPEDSRKGAATPTTNVSSRASLFAGPTPRGSERQLSVPNTPPRSASQSRNYRKGSESGL